jgi:hypothetical protein
LLLPRAALFCYLRSTTGIFSINWGKLCIADI